MNDFTCYQVGILAKHAIEMKQRVPEIEPALYTSAFRSRQHSSHCFCWWYLIRYVYCCLKCQRDSAYIDQNWADAKNKLYEAITGPPLYYKVILYEGKVSFDDNNSPDSR